MRRRPQFTRALRNLANRHSGYRSVWGERLPVTLAELFDRLRDAPPDEFVIGTLSQLFRTAGASAKDRRRALFVLWQLAKTVASTDTSEWATYDLSFTWEPRAIPHLLDLLNDPQRPAVVRTQAAEGIGNCLPERVVRRQHSRLYRRCVTALVAALDDPHPNVRFYAAFSLGKLRARTALPRLRQLAEHDNAEASWMWSVKEEAVDAIHSIEHDCPPEPDACERTGWSNQGRPARE